MFKRKIYDKLLQWKHESNGSTALLIEGARRVGKSTVVQEFGKNEYDSFIFIDFSAAKQSVLELFNNFTDLNYFFLQIQLQYKTDLIERKSLIIFDEVQLCPKARQAIKHLVRDHRYDYIETGSLISIRRNVKDIVIPSEERKLSMYPMDYEEFLWAVGDSATCRLLRQAFESGIKLGEKTNRELLQRFRLYMLVGGMPQAVDAYLKYNNFKKTDLVKRDIINLYMNDFAKIDPKGRISALFENIPAQLNKNDSRYHVSSVLKNYRAEDILELVFEMQNSGIVLTSYHTNDPVIGMSATKDLTKFKLYICDTGLFATLMFKDKDFTDNVIYEKLLNDKLPVNLGYLYENAVAQMLTAEGNSLFYHTFQNKENKRKFEIDFLISRKNKICPLEIKSSGYQTHASLDAFIEKYHSRILSSYVIYTKDTKKENNIQYLPVYMVPFL